LTDQPTQRPPTSLRRALLGSAAFFLLGLLIFSLILVPFAPRLFGEASVEELTRAPTIELLLAQGIGLIGAYWLATWLVGIRALHLDLRDLRWRTSIGWLRAFGVGLVLGILPAASAMLLGLLAGGASWVPDEGSLLDYLGRMGFLLLLLAPAALAEEIIFRGVPLVVMSDALGRPAALILLSVGFALAHVTNPDITTLALGNIALAGILLSVAFFSPGGIWTAFGAHLGWNGTLAGLGAPVSGLPFEIPLVDYAIYGPGWLAGGKFGPEGGLISTFTITVAVVLTARWLQGRST
jgi:membrane protease YdiL (CAAX protease family)